MNDALSDALNDAAPPRPRRCLIVDDHPLMREAMASLARDIDPGVDLATAGTLAAARALASGGGEFDALICDLNLPDGDGAVLVAEFRSRWPALPILVLTASEEPNEVRRLIAAGANGFAPKSAAYATLSAALRLVLAGQTYLPPLMLQAEHELDPAGDDPTQGEVVQPGHGGKLTPRQVEVLRLVCEGLSNKQISRRLGLAERTIKVHVGAIFRALEVNNRTQAAMAARASGLIELKPASPA